MLNDHAAQLANTLVTAGIVSRSQCDAAAGLQRHYLSLGVSRALADVLVELGYTTSAALREFTAGAVKPARLPPAVLADTGCKLLGLDGDALVVAPLTPLGDAHINKLLAAARTAGLPVSRVRQVVEDSASVLSAVSRMRRQSTNVAGLVHQLNMGEVVPYDTLVDALIVEAAMQGASDIHITRRSNHADNVISYRVNGDLSPKYWLTPAAIGPFVQSLRMRSLSDAGNTLTTQSGLLRLPAEDIDVRVSTMPLGGGDGRDAPQSIVMRVLDANSKPTLAALMPGYPRLQHAITEIVNRENKQNPGLVLLSGPTGSGKSSTLYASMLAADRSRRKLASVEDPIERYVAGVAQSQLNEDGGLTYATAARELMRQDPDVIYIGEVRDPPTAVQVLRAVETGHTVLTTVHAGNVVGTFARFIALLPTELRESGIQTLSETISLVLHQQLVKAPGGRMLSPEALIMSDASQAVRERLQRALSAGQGVREVIAECEYIPRGET